MANTGSYLQFESGNPNSITTAYFDPIFKNNKDIIAEFSYIPPNTHNVAEAQISRIQAADKARIETLPVSVYGVQPNIFEATLKAFIKPNYSGGSSLPFGDQLYTARGS